MPSTVRFQLDDAFIQDTLPSDAYKQRLSSPTRPHSILRRPTPSPPSPSNSTISDQSAYSSTFPSTALHLACTTSYSPPSRKSHKGQLAIFQFDQVQESLMVGHDNLSTTLNRGYAESSTLSNHPLSNDLSKNPDERAALIINEDYFEMLTTKKIRRHRLSRSLSEQSNDKAFASSSSSCLNQQPERNMFPQEIDTIQQNKFINNIEEIKTTKQHYHRYCQFPIKCKELKLNWSKYCFKHQCRAFLCYQHVLKANIAFCEEHYRDSDPEMVQ